MHSTGFTVHTRFPRHASCFTARLAHARPPPLAPPHSKGSDEDHGEVKVIPGRARFPSLRDSVAESGSALLKKFAKKLPTSHNEEKGNGKKPARGGKESPAAGPRVVPKKAFVAHPSDDKAPKVVSAHAPSSSPSASIPAEHGRIYKKGANAPPPAHKGGSASTSDTNEGMHRVSDPTGKHEVLLRRHVANAEDSPTSMSWSSPRASSGTHVTSNQRRIGGGGGDGGKGGTGGGTSTNPGPSAGRATSGDGSGGGGGGGDNRPSTPVRNPIGRPWTHEESSLKRRAATLISPSRSDGGVRIKAVAHARPGARLAGTEGPSPGRGDHYKLPNIEKSEKDMALIMRAYAACVLFDGLPPGAPRKLALAMAEMTVKPSTDIIKQGSSMDDSFYIVVEGKVSVWHQPDPRLNGDHKRIASDNLTEFTKGLQKREEKDMGANKDAGRGGEEGGGDSEQKQQLGHERFLRALGPGEYFGEVALLYDTKRTATVRSQTSGGCRIFQLHREHFVMAGRGITKRGVNQRRGGSRGVLRSTSAACVVLIRFFAQAVPTRNVIGCSTFDKQACVDVTMHITGVSSRWAVRGMTCIGCV